MNDLERGAAIPVAEALRLCELALAENRRRWWDPAALQCRGCVRFSPEPTRRCFAAAPGNRGCRFVTRRWERRPGPPR